MRNFKEEDISGGGQYLIRLDANQRAAISENKTPFVKDTGYLSTIMYKVGYLHNPPASCLIAMSDGWVRYGEIKEGKLIPWETTSKSLGRTKLVNYLNNGDEEYRFATQEEIVRVVMYQRGRWRNQKQ